MSPHHIRGFTWIEVLVSLLIIGVCSLVFLPIFLSNYSGHTQAKVRGQLTQTLSNMKQLHLATEQMALDGSLKTKPTPAWPGDTGSNLATWAAALVQGDYLTTNDLAKLLSVPGKILPPDKLPSVNTNGVLLYAVRELSPTNAIFLATANFIPSPTGGTIDPQVKPYRDKGYAVFRRDGSGQIFCPPKTADTNITSPYVPLCH